MRLASPLNWVGDKSIPEPLASQVAEFLAQRPRRLDPLSPLTPGRSRR